MGKIPFLGGLRRGLAGFEIGANSLKLVLLQPGRKEVAFLAAGEIKGLPDDEVSKAAAAAFKEIAPLKPRVALIVPSPIVITKNIEVPSVESRELREIINLQAARHTPFSREEIIIDYIPIGTYKQNYTKILLFIVTSTAVKKQIIMLEKAGIAVEKVLLSAEAFGPLTARAIKGPAEAPYGFVHIDEFSSDFSVLHKSRLLFIRAVPVGRQQLAQDKEKAFPKFVEEIKKSMETYRAECIEKDPQGLFCGGCLDGLEDLDLALSAATHLPVKDFDYWNSFQLAPAARKTAQDKKNLSFLGVLAPLAAFPECKVNLLPEEIRLKRLLQQRGLDLFSGGILLLSALFLLLFIALGQMYFKGEYLKALDARYGGLAGGAREVEQLLHKNSMIQSYLGSRGYSVKVLGELHELTPLNMELSDVRFEREGKLTVRGTGDSMSTVFTFVDQLEKSRYFKDVKTRYTTKRQEGKRDVTDFEINAMISKAAE